MVACYSSIWLSIVIDSWRIYSCPYIQPLLSIYFFLYTSFILYYATNIHVYGL